MIACDENVTLDDLLKIKWMFEQQRKMTGLGTWEWDIQTDKSIWSDELYSIYGIDCSTPINYKAAANFWHDDDRERIDKAIKRAIDDKSQYELEYRIVRKSGDVRYIHSFGKVCTDQSGTPSKIIGTMMDITEKKQLQWDHTFQSCLLSAVNEAIIATDAGGVLKFINKKAQEVYRIRGHELIGHDYTELLKKTNMTFPAQEVRDKLRDIGSAVFELSYETEGGCKWHEVHSKSVRDDAGDIIGVVCASRDVTHRKASEAKIKSQNTILKQINMIYKHAMSCETVQSLGKMCLGIIEKVTNSPLSFIGEIGLNGEFGVLATNTFYWDDKKDADMLRRLMHSQSAMIINDAKRYKLPNSHVEIRSFLEVPYMRGERLAGLLCVANREGGYTTAQKELLEALAPSIIETLLSKRAGEHLRDSELLMRTIMDSASDFIFLKNKDSRVVMINQAYGRIFNVNINEVIGKNDYELYSDPDMAAEVIENDRHVMETGKTLICQESAMTAEGYKTFSLSKVPWRDVNGDIIGVLGIAHDVTELNETKNSLLGMVDSLKRSNEYIELLYAITEKLLSSTTPRKDIRDLCDKVMNFLDCDAYFNYLYSDGDECMRLNACHGISPKTMRDIELLPVGAAVCGCALQQRCKIISQSIQQTADPRTDLVKSLGIRAYACHPLMADGEIFGTLSFGTRKKDFFNQEELMLMSTVADTIAVSIRRKQTEEKIVRQAKELRLKNKLITDFFVNVSHEFKTPLSILKLAAELIDHNYQSGSYEKLSSYIGMVRSNSNRLTRLVGNLLDMTKVDAGFMVPKRSMIDIISLLENIVESIRIYASKRALTADFLSDVQSRIVYTDSNMVERIVLNLLSNAIKHTHTGGHISLEFQNGRDHITIAVKDDGEGIPDDKTEMIFDRFRQVNSSFARSNEGCGIGLALSKSLAELLGGRIWLQSVYGKGSSFFVELPVVCVSADNAVVTEVENMENSVTIELSDISF